MMSMSANKVYNFCLSILMPFGAKVMSLVYQSHSAYSHIPDLAQPCNEYTLLGVKKRNYRVVID